jgi:hypothetical protein
VPGGDLLRPTRLARALALRFGLAEPGHHILLVWNADPDGERAPTISVLQT